MPDRNQDALDFMLSRRSRPAKTLTAPVPDREALTEIITAGLRVPDHGKLEPWRLVVLEAAALDRIAGLVAPHGARLGTEPEKIEKLTRQFADADLAIAVVATPAPSEKVPEIEQLYSAGAVCLSLLNAALAAGWGANWLSGWASHDAGFAEEALGLAEGERIAGFIHIGTEKFAAPERPRPDLGQKVSWVAE